MKSLIRYSSAIALVLLLAGCGLGRGRSAAGTSEVREFPAAPSVPAVLTDSVQIAEYLAGHFWDAFTDTSKVYRCDSAYVNGVKKETVGKALAGYLSLLEQNCPVDFSRKAISEFYGKVERFEASDTSTNMLEYFEGKVAEYLYDPNSPLRNEDLFLPFVSGLEASRYIPEDSKMLYEYQVKMCSLNRIGTKAADFIFTDRAGKRQSLYSIKADAVLLFFSNPGCPACEAITRMIEMDNRISTLVKSRKLAVVNVYIDQELDKWKEMSASYPPEWHCGYDQDYVIRTDVTYDVRAIPSLYILDKDKKVVMKDAPVENVLAYLDKR